ncbi:MAG: DUF3565 domain-containing protein [Chloroflexi bacterium]|nr:DUF3565 domain-containing protein [Chloroflexota bacterium]
MKQPIINYHQDRIGDWVAELICGHTQHVRHDPPLINRPWVLSKAGRGQFIGFELDCKECSEHSSGKSISE